MITTIPKVSKPIIPSIMNINTTVITTETIILGLFFISIVNGELKPDQAEVPIDACITMIYFAIISAVIITKNNLMDDSKLDSAIYRPIKLIISAVAPADPTSGSDIAFLLDALSPFFISPSAKSAKASI